MKFAKYLFLPQYSLFDLIGLYSVAMLAGAVSAWFYLLLVIFAAASFVAVRRIEASENIKD